MNLQTLAETAQDLSDLELATLLCLVAKQHCLIETEEDIVDDLAQELALIVSDVFGLTYTVIQFDEKVTIDDFSDAVIDQTSGSPDNASEVDHADARSDSGRQSRLDSVVIGHVESKLDYRKVVNVIIAKNFNEAQEDVQIQALELIRRNRMFSRTTIHATPKVFLFLPLISTASKGVRLNKHLNDSIFISHYHDPEDGFLNLEEIDAGYMSDEHGSSSSPDRKPNSISAKDLLTGRRIDVRMIGKIRQQSATVTMTPEIRRYLQNIVVFLRLERGVRGGVSPNATTFFELLAKCLAPLHGLDYVSPSLVALAAKKIYRHRIAISLPEKERSMQYGSELDAVRELLNGVTPETVIDAVLNSVECPL